MRRSIYKYPAPLKDYFRHEMHAGSEILCVQTQDDDAKVWALVNTDAPVVERKFAWYGTGWDLHEDDLGVYVGTVQMMDGELIWHLFDLGES